MTESGCTLHPCAQVIAEADLASMTLQLQKMQDELQKMQDANGVTLVESVELRAKVSSMKEEMTQKDLQLEKVTKELEQCKKQLQCQKEDKNMKRSRDEGVETDPSMRTKPRLARPTTMTITWNDLVDKAEREREVVEINEIYDIGNYVESSERIYTERRSVHKYIDLVGKVHRIKK